MSRPKIGVIGSGDVGKRLAGAFAKLGHPVMLGTREPSREDVQAWLKEAGHGARAGTNAEAARFGDIIVLATDWSGTENALRLAGAPNLQGKVLLDVTNPLSYRDGAPPLLAVSGEDSGAERVQRWAPGAKVVKSLNVVNNAQMADPKAFGNPTMFVAGDEGAKKVVEGLLRELGWDDVIDLGGLEGARMLEAMALVWIVHGFRTGKWTHALKMLPAR